MLRKRVGGQRSGRVDQFIGVQQLLLVVGQPVERRGNGVDLSRPDPAIVNGCAHPAEGRHRTGPVGLASSGATPNPAAVTQQRAVCSSTLRLGSMPFRGNTDQQNQPIKRLLTLPDSGDQRLQLVRFARPHVEPRHHRGE